MWDFYRVVSVQMLPRSMGIPAQALPVRPSQRDAAAASPYGKADHKGAADGPEKKPTLRQTYNLLADPEKHPKLSDTTSLGESADTDRLDDVTHSIACALAPQAPQDACMHAFGPEDQLQQTQGELAGSARSMCPSAQSLNSDKNADVFAAARSQAAAGTSTRPIR